MRLKRPIVRARFGPVYGVSAPLDEKKPPKLKSGGIGSYSRRRLLDMLLTAAPRPTRYTSYVHIRLCRFIDDAASTSFFIKMPCSSPSPMTGLLRRRCSASHAQPQPQLASTAVYAHAYGGDDSNSKYKTTYAISMLHLQYRDTNVDLNVSSLAKNASSSSASASWSRGSWTYAPFRATRVSWPRRR
ncbi:hypothetical protein CPC08DRAFT_226814 [Agrocybe pediades]|nr:hypothetical protein CPC08DRAFT_226814 [Agrocybe pediades]